MIQGKVNTDDEAVVLLTLRNVNGTLGQIEAVIDTGFNEYLTLPRETIVELSLPYLGNVDVMLADGSITEVAIYQAIVQWDETERIVPVQEENVQPLAGTSLLRGYRISIDFVEGGKVEISRLMR